MTRLITKISADNIDAHWRQYEADTQVLACHDSVRKAMLKKISPAIILAAAGAIVGALGVGLSIDLYYNASTMYADSLLNIARTRDII